MTDAPDFTGKYNTKLDPGDEIDFLNWAKNQRRGPAASALNDLYDYDLRGWWKQNGSQSLSDAHLTDEFKKPNHPTFSDESIYSGADGYEGGKWSGDNTTGYSFTPSDTNLKMRDPAALQDYFQTYEPAVKLNMPGAP